jgi:hypothetical protein
MSLKRVIVVCYFRPQIFKPAISKARHAMYVHCNTVARSCNHCCNGRAISTTYSECVFVPVGVQHAMRVRHIVICGLPNSTIFFYIVSRLARLSEKKICVHKICFEFLYDCLKRFSF